MTATRPLWQHPAAIAITALAILVLATMSISVIPETRQGLVLRYGQIVRVINPWSAGQAYGSGGAGISLRMPFVEQIRMFDKRILGVTLDNQPVMSTDQVRLEVDAYARYRIVDVRRVYQTLGTEQRLKEQLNLLLATALRNELGKRTFSSLLSSERNAVMSAISRSLQLEAQSFGVRIVDVRINRAELPVGAPRDSVFARMRSAREQQASNIAAEGEREARVIRADADAEAARIYAASFGKDPQFYAFYRAMQSYQTTFRSRGAGPSTFILPPGEGYLSEFTPRQR